MQKTVHTSTGGVDATSPATRFTANPSPFPDATVVIMQKKGYAATGGVNITLSVTRFASSVCPGVKAAFMEKPGPGVANSRCALRAVQLYADGGQFDFARPSEPTPHGAYVEMSRQNHEEDPCGNHCRILLWPGTTWRSAPRSASPSFTAKSCDHARESWLRQEVVMGQEVMISTRDAGSGDPLVGGGR